MGAPSLPQTVQHAKSPCFFRNFGLTRAKTARPERSSYGAIGPCGIARTTRALIRTSADSVSDELRAALGLTSEHIRGLGAQRPRAASIIEHAVHHGQRFFGGGIARRTVRVHTGDLRNLRQPAPSRLFCTLEGDSHEREYGTLAWP